MLGFLLLAAAVPEIVVQAPRPRPLPAAPVPNRELAAIRGGLLLPNGLNVTIGIDIQTRVNGLLALHTVYASEGAATGVRVFRDGANPVPVAPATQSVSGGPVWGVPLLVVDRSPTGTTVLPSTQLPATNVNLVNGDQSTWLSGEGQVEVPVAAGAPVQTPDGTVTLTRGENGTEVALQSPTLLVRQLVGQATGVVIANTANNQVIDTVSSVNVDAKGLTPELSAGLFAAQRAALDAVLSRP